MAPIFELMLHLATILDHKHEFFFGSDPQTVRVKAGETVYFQYVGSM
jgi:hypothetical protein